MSEYLSEEEQLAQLKSWWQRYGLWLVAAVVLGLGGYFLLQYMEDQRASKNAAASEVFERYQEVAADESAAKPLLGRLDGEFAGTAYQLMSLMSRAQRATDAGDIEAAVGFYTRATEAPEVEHFTDVARLRLARALQQQERGDEAIKVLGAVKGEGYRSLVAELKGDILAAKGDKSGARDAYAAAADAQGDNPRTLLSMKLANLSAPERMTDQSESSAGNEATSAESESDVSSEAVTSESVIDESRVDESSVDGSVIDEGLETVVDTASDSASGAAAELSAEVEGLLDESATVTESQSN